MKQIYIPQNDYKVLVMCFTYNHAKYIEDALNGFAMQQTNFPFVCLVMDDCSTDGEQEVIKSWMERECDMQKSETMEIEKSFITIVPHKTNTNCTFVFYFLKQNMYKVKYEKLEMVNPWRKHCEYEASCEGDDYWIDPLKLQKQVDWLDEHSDYSFISSNYKIIDISGEYFGDTQLLEDGYSFNDFLVSNRVGTLTVLFRICFMSDYISPFPDLKMGDYPMWLHLAMRGKHKCLYESTAIYRKLETSASHYKERDKALLFDIDTLRIKDYYAEKGICRDQIFEMMQNSLHCILDECFVHDYKEVITPDFLRLCKTYRCLSIKNRLKLFALKNKMFYPVFLYIKQK